MDEGANQKRLSGAEVEMLFSAQGAEMEALVAFARSELAYRQQRAALASMAEEAAARKSEIFTHVVRAHGFDPDHFEADIEHECIMPKGGLSVFAPDSTRETERERARANTVKLRHLGGENEDG